MVDHHFASNSASEESRKAEIATNLMEVQERIRRVTEVANRQLSEISLIVVTKTYPLSDINHLYDLKVRNFGENRISEGALKAETKFPDAKWHFQGQIQSNKIGSLVKWADVIHTISNLRHAEKINANFQAQKPVLIQVALDSNEHRGGVSPANLADLATSIMQLPQLELKGLMAIAPLAEDPERAFTRLSSIYQRFIADFPRCNWLSAGMSNDFECAILHGATHIRIGSSILGKRT